MKRLVVVLAVIGLLTIAVWGQETLNVYFLDVGQGDAILIDYGAYEMLIDGGPDGACVAEIAPYIDGHLEVVVATHPHSDHIGGLDDVIRAFTVEEVYANGDRSATTNAYKQFAAAVDAAGLLEVKAATDRPILLGDLAFEVLNPRCLSGDANEDSVALMLSFGEVDFLFTGDIESGAESDLLQSDLLPNQIEVLKVAHHGSKYSTSDEFLDQINPVIAIYSAGVGNRYGHPHEETLDALEESGTEIFGTDVDGTIHVAVSDGQIRVSGQATVRSYVYGVPYSENTDMDVTAQITPCTAALVINEVEMNPSGSDSGCEWVEILNRSNTEISLSGWDISYTGYGGGWHSLPEVALEACGRYVYLYPVQHLENSRGQSIQLRSPSGEVADETSLGLTDTQNDSRTWQRVPDGSDTDTPDDWVFRAASRNASNN